MNHEQAAFATAMFVQGLENEYTITRKVLAAVPEEKKDFPPRPGRTHCIRTRFSHR